jgi:MFS transporter, DHA1 family, inner membrane transport protein
MTLPLLSLFLAGFAIATSSFVVAGLLPEIAVDLAVSIPTAGLLVTAYAAAVAIGGPVLSLLTSRFPRKPTILVLMAVFVLGQIACALSPTYEILLAARMLVSLSHGTFFGLAAILAVSMVAPDKRGSAISLVFAGITVATIIGVPTGTAIGHAFGWRMAFWCVAAVAVAAAAVMAILLPANSAPRGAGAGLAQQFRVLARQQVWLSYAIIVLLMLGIWSTMTYVSPLLAEATAMPQHLIPWMLLVFGVGSTVGLFLGGRLDRWSTSTTLIAGFATQILIYCTLAFFVGTPVVVGILLFLVGFAGFVVNAPLQNRVLRGAADAPDLASTVMSSMFNVGIAAGASLGAMMLSGGATYAHLPWVGFALAIPATGLCLVAALLDRPRTVAT